MDDLRRSLGSFDADAPLPAAPDPWDFQPTPRARSEPPWAMAEMIAAEPALAVRVGRRVMADDTASASARLVRETAQAGEEVLVTGCGTSEHAAMAVAAILRDARRQVRLPGPDPRSVQAFELSLDPPAAGLVIGCSHEGGTAATSAALAAAGAGGARTVLITASAGSPAAAGRDLVVATHELDQSWCHTVGYVSPVTVAVMVAGELVGERLQPGAVGRRLAEGIEAAHGGTPDGDGRPDATIAVSLAAAHRLLIVASGADRITARELALKIEEASWLPAATRDLETFLHGHLPPPVPSTGLLLVLLERDGLDAAHEASAPGPARGRRGRDAAAAALLGSEAASRIPAELTPAGRVVVPESTELAGAAATLLGAATPLQLVTLAIARGPGHQSGSRSDATTPSTCGRPTWRTTRGSALRAPPIGASQLISTSPARSIMSRSRAMKSWSIIRSTPASAKRATIARASSGVPWIQRARRASNQSAPPSGSPNACEQRGLPSSDLVRRRSRSGSRPSQNA